MKRNHVIGMVCGYYLSRFDEHGYKRWGFASKKETHRELGELLGVRAESIKNWRDEFDPFHDNLRQGWHNREMIPSRRRVLEALEDLSEADMFTILRGAVKFPEGEIAEMLINSVSEKDTDINGKAFSSRGVTGKKAEVLFMEHHKKHDKPVSGELVDRRDEGCGYDFEVYNRRESAAIEVKGLSGFVGGILFTEKEWSTAQNMCDNYYLVIVRNVIVQPEFSFVQNPAAYLQPHQRVYTTLHFSFSVSGQHLTDVEEKMES